MVYSKNYPPTKAQKDFWDWIAQHDCINHCGEGIQLHHILGASAKHNKIHIGQWLLIPLCVSCHDRVNQLWPDKKWQIQLFIDNVLEPYWRRFGDVPMNKDELLAIMTWSR